MAAEVLVVTPAIRSLIRDDKVHQIYSSMQSGKKFGMQTLNDALYALCLSKDITMEDALKVTSSPDELLRMLGKEPEVDPKTGAPTRPLTGGLAGKR
jgi:twitching motility protein PilT